MSDPRRDDMFDQDLRHFLAAEADDRRGVPSAAEMALRIAAPMGAGARRPRTARSLAWLVLAALLAVALAGAVLVGVGGLRDGLAIAPAPSAGSTAYVPVFLRVDDRGDLVVFSADPDGDETELLRRPDGVLLGTYSYGGAVSTNGLLAVPRASAVRFHWEIFDLAEPGAEPIVVPGEQDREPFLRPTPYVGLDSRGGAFWGPHDQLAIVSYVQVPIGGGSSAVDPYITFVDGRTGVTRTVDIPDDDGTKVMPVWVSDGSGVLLAGPSRRRGDTWTEPVTGILRQDGTVDHDVPGLPVDEQLAALAERTTAFCQFHDPGAYGEFACVAPDESMFVRWPGTVVVSGRPPFEVDGAWVGWLETPM